MTRAIDAAMLALQEAGHELAELRRRCDDLEAELFAYENTFGRVEEVTTV